MSSSMSQHCRTVPPPCVVQGVCFAGVRALTHAHRRTSSTQRCRYRLACGCAQRQTHASLSALSVRGLAQRERRAALVANRPQAPPRRRPFLSPRARPFRSPRPDFSTRAWGRGDEDRRDPPALPRVTRGCRGRKREEEEWGKESRKERRTVEGVGWVELNAVAFKHEEHVRKGGVPAVLEGRVRGQSADVECGVRKESLRAEAVCSVRTPSLGCEKGRSWTEAVQDRPAGLRERVVVPLH
eukprot:2447223-Rhodomonas_salina.1